MSGTGATIKGEARGLILDAAAALFAQHGVEAVSLRTINAAAGVSPGVLHYHFGSREVLVSELINRHMNGLMGEREARLSRLMKQARPELRDIMVILVEPLARLALDDPGRGSTYVRFIARLYADNSPILAEVSERHLHVNALYPELLQRALPDRDPLELQQRFAMANHALLQTLADLCENERDWIQSASGGAAGRKRERQLSLLVDFITAGMRGL